MCDLNDTELASYKTGASVWGTVRCHCAGGQYNFWLNIRNGDAPNKSEDVACGMLVGGGREGERESWFPVITRLTGLPTRL